MVTVVNYRERILEDDHSFFVLVLQGAVTPMRSDETGNIYFTAMKATVPTTFDENTCKSLIGNEFPGQIEKVACKPYDYVIEETDEVIRMSHRYEYYDESVDAVENQVISESEVI